MVNFEFLLTSFRCCIHWDGCPTSSYCPYGTAGEDERTLWQDNWEHNILGFFCLDWTTSGGASLLFRVAGQVWEPPEAVSNDEIMIIAYSKFE